MPPGQTLAMYTQLMAINALSYAGGQYTVAYHALVAALHCAQDLRDSARALAVLQRADEQREAIDRQAPDQRLANPVVGMAAALERLQPAGSPGADDGRAPPAAAA